VSSGAFARLSFRRDEASNFWFRLIPPLPHPTPRSRFWLRCGEPHPQPVFRGWLGLYQVDSFDSIRSARWFRQHVERSAWHRRPRQRMRSCVVRASGFCARNRTECGRKATDQASPSTSRMSGAWARKIRTSGRP